MDNTPVNPEKTILLVDDDAESRIMLKWCLSSLGYVVDSARSAEEALSLFDPKIHDLIVTDNRMPGMTGLEMSSVIKARSEKTPILMYTGRPPTDPVCVDMVLPRPSHFLVLEEGIAKLLNIKSNQVFQKAVFSKKT